MPQIFENYLDSAFGEHKQADFKIKQFKKNYFRFFPKNKNAKILDIGPGRGEMLTCLRNCDYNNVKAIDISSSIVDFCKGLGYDCELVEDTKAFINQHKNTFQMITMCDVLEHIPKSQVLDLLVTIKVALTSDGIAIFQIPNMQSVNPSIHMYNDFTHEQGYTEHSLTQIFKTCGFSSMEYYGFETLGNSIKDKIHYCLRKFYWSFVFINRKINGDLTVKVYHPVFFAVVKK